MGLGHINVNVQWCENCCSDCVNCIMLYCSVSVNCVSCCTASGLSVKEYLEGKEGKHKELMYKSSKSGRRTGASGGAGLVPGVRRTFDDGEETTYVMSDDMQVRVGYGMQVRGMLLITDITCVTHH